MHEKRELSRLIDKTMGEDCDPEEACRYLKIGLICTQGMGKLRPSMSAVVRMLKGEIDVEGKNISRPGLLSEFMSLRPNNGSEDRKEPKNASYTVSSGSGKLADSSFSSKDVPTSFATMTFNSIYDNR